MNLLYNFGISLFSLGVKIASLRNPKARKMVKGQAATMATLRKAVRPGEKYVWVHAASLGEFEQGRPLIERLRRERRDLKIALTFFSPSGYEVRHNYNGADVVVYLPLDTPGNAREFLDILNPVTAIFVKYEFWGNYLTQLHRRGIPTYIISAIFRPGQIFFKPWGGMFRRWLGYYKTLYVQDDNSRDLLSGIGIDNVVVAGDTRFDRVTDIMRSTVSISGMYLFGYKYHPVIVFGSSWEADEAVYIPWLKKNPNVCAVIAPHEFDDARLESLRRQLTIRPGDTMLLSEYEKRFTPPSDGSCGLPNPEGIRVIIVDSFGLLSSLYRYGTIAYVGGGFGHGIHNLNEAAVYGMPVIFGPKHQKFKEAAGLIDCGGGFSISSAEQFCDIADNLISDPESLEKAGKAAGDYIKSNLGATDKIFNDVFNTDSL